MTESIFDYPQTPEVERTGRRVAVRHAGESVADSTQCWRMLEKLHPPVYYIPRVDVSGRLTPSARRTFCPYKGVASYWDLHAGGTVVPDAAWSYEDPKPRYAMLRGAVAFYPAKVDECMVDGVRVARQVGDFSGGWLTPDVNAHATIWRRMSRWWATIRLALTPRRER